MANFKRKKCKRQVRCTMCTDNRWKGNRKDRRPAKEPKDISVHSDDFSDTSVFF